MNQEQDHVRDIVVKDKFVALTLDMESNDPAQEEKYKQQITETLQQNGISDVHIRVKQREEQTPNPAAAAENKPSILSSESRTKIIAIASGKGGVGKSTVTANLAVALQRIGKKVGIIDADIYGFSIPAMFGLKEQSLSDPKRLIPLESNGISIISTGFFVKENNPVVWRGPMLGKMLMTFFNDVQWPELDYMLLDLPPGTGDVALNIHQKIPHSAEIIVTTPDPAASYVAERAGAMALRTNHEIIGVVENMSYFEDETGSRHYIFGKNGGTKLAKQLQTEVLAQIPIEPLKSSEENNHFPSFIYQPDSQNGLIYRELADKILNN